MKADGDVDLTMIALLGRARYYLICCLEATPRRARLR
jgi:hypothetical protein